MVDKSGGTESHRGATSRGEDRRAAGASDGDGEAGGVLRPLLDRSQWSGTTRLQSRQLKPVCYRKETLNLLLTWCFRYKLHFFESK